MTTNLASRRAALTLSLLVSTGVAACGAAGDWFPSDVDEAKSLAADTQAVGRVCDAFADWVYDQYRDSLAVEIACTASGIEQSADAAACGAFVRDCIDDPPAEVAAAADALIAAVGCGAISYQPSGCGQTISDLRICLDDVSVELDQLRYTVECTAAGQPLSPAALTIDVPASCLAIENACPTP